jgi:amidohydrolase
MLTGTLRSFNQNTRKLLLNRFKEVVESIACSYRCQVDIVIDDISPPVVNDPEIAEVIRDAAREILPQALIDQSYKTTASEDMSLIMEQIPGCYFFVGSSNQDKDLVAKHHQPDFNFDEEALVYGTAIMVSAVQRILS